MTTNKITANASRMRAIDIGEEMFARARSLELAGAHDHILESVVEGYLAAFLWTTADDARDTAENGEGHQTGEPMLDSNYDVHGVVDSVKDALKEELSGIIAQHPLAFRMYLARRSSPAGPNHFGLFVSPDLEGVASYWAHDFLLTRDGHGTGFWDRGLDALGDYWTKIAKSYGSSEDLYLQDNGQGQLA